VIDDERFDRSIGRFEPKAELCLERSEDRGNACWVGSGGCSVRGLRRHTVHLGSLPGELDANLESSIDSGLVDHWTVYYQEEQFGKIIESPTFNLCRGGRSRADLALCNIAGQPGAGQAEWKEARRFPR
jgi:hypothetical protein